MKLTAQNHRAIELLAAGNNGKDTAEKLNLTQETISRWRGDFDFRARLNDILMDNQEAVGERLRQLSTLALETLEITLKDDQTPARDKITASLKVLELAKVTPQKIGSSDAKTLQKKHTVDKLFGL